MLSCGGAAGGVFVGLLAPNLFNGYHEFPIGLVLCAGLAALVLLREQGAWFRRSWGRVCGLAMLAALAAYGAFLGWVVRDSVQGYRLVARNFYSQLRVREVDEDDDMGLRRKLLHGVINHGEQILSEPYRRKPVAYFCPETGIGQAMLAGKEGVPRRIGILGLGCGVLVAYGHAGDSFRIYEINPLVLELARNQFTYLADTPARVEVVLGDGRLSLEREPDQHFDLLVMDAFSGDSVPVHLITREALRTYFRHLQPGGILAVNVSNKYLDLLPVMEAGARCFGKVALYSSFTAEDDDVICFSVGWVLIADPATSEAMSKLAGSLQRLPERADFRIWTDDYSNLFRILK
jgi:SAM-dependent methyltransferase